MSKYFENWNIEINQIFLFIYSTVTNKRRVPNSRGMGKNLENSISGGLSKREGVELEKRYLEIRLKLLLFIRKTWLVHHFLQQHTYGTQKLVKIR